MSLTLTDYVPTYLGCRYCLMCRHVCPVGLVTRRESTTPHGWALLLASVDRGQRRWDAEAVDTLYQCADCGLCQADCVTDQPLPAAIVAARDHVVRVGAAPPAVAEVATRLAAWGNAYAATAPDTAPEGQAETVLFVGATAQHLRPQTLAAARRLLERLGIGYKLVGVGRASAYLPYTLGLWDTARRLAQATVDEIEAAGARRLLVLSAEDAHAFRHLHGRLRLAPPALEVTELVGLLSAALRARALQPLPLEQSLVYLDPAHTPRLPARAQVARQVAAALTRQPLRQLPWRGARALPIGAVGGLEFTQPALAAQLTSARLDEAAATGADILVTEDPLALHHLSQRATGRFRVEGLYELLAQQLA